MISITNDGQRIASSNYWQSSLADAGLPYLSCHRGAIRLLVPPGCQHAVEEMRTARAVVLSVGAWPPDHQREGAELLFDNGFAVHLEPGCFDQLPPEPAPGRDWRLSEIGSETV